MAKKLLVSILVAILFSGYLTAQIHVARFDFNGNANDLSGYKNHGEVYGATLTTDRFGNENSAYIFDGIDDYILVPFIEKYNFDTSNFALSVWVKSTNTSKIGMIFQKGSRYGELTHTPQFWLRTNDGVQNKKLIFLTADGLPPSPSPNVYTDTIEVNDGNWHHIIAQKKDTLLELYLDSKLVGHEIFYNQENLNDSSRIIIGAQNPALTYNGIGNHFDGIIDDIKLFAYALSSEDVRFLYQEEKCTSTVFDTVTITIYDTLTIYDTVLINDTLIVNDTIIIYDTIQVNDTITINVCPTDLSENIETNIMVYPNPTEDLINIEINDPDMLQNHHISIIDMSGKILYSKSIDSDIIDLSMKSLGSSGLYILQILNNKNQALVSKGIVLN